jgi:type 2 lantibiotic biosynthesis protein LanM
MKTHLAELPFSEVLSGHLQEAKEKLKLPKDLLAKSAVDDFVLILAKRLTTLISPILYEEFEKERPEGVLLYHLFLGNDDEPADNTYYNAYIQKLLGGGLSLFWARYPVLGDLFSQITNMWVESSQELLLRLESDMEWIADELFATSVESMGKVIGIQGDFSDPHCGGRSVLILEFQGGQICVYKPKDLQIDQAFSDLLRDVNKKFSTHQLRVPKLLAAQGYGWCEFIKHKEFHSESSVLSFYRKAGKLLALVYALRGTDCHQENVIVDGDSPVLIDSEMLLQPSSHGLYSIHNMLIFSHQADHSVLSTALLPQWLRHPLTGEAFTVSAFANQEIKQTKPSWKRVNTDEMHCKLDDSQVPVGTHLVRLNGELIDSSNYLNEIVQGFEELYPFLEKNPSLFSRFKGLKSRYIHRETMAYAKVLQNSLLTKALRSTEERDQELNILSRAFTLEEGSDKSLAILSSELSALKRLDIPYFFTQTDSRDLYIDEKTKIASFFTLSAFESLSSVDMQVQIDKIKGSFNQLPSIRPFSGGSKLEQAKEWAQEIAKRAYRDGLGFLNWDAPTTMQKTQKIQYAPMGIDLYQGRIGTCLFLAALDSLLAKSMYKDLIHSCLDPIVSYYDKASPFMIEQYINAHGLGSCLGLSSIVYGFLQISEFLSEDSYLHCAEKLAASLSPKLIQRDSHFDICSGSSGALLVFNALYSKTASKVYLDSLIYCAEHLIKMQEIDGSWKVQAKQAYCGFSHGASGVAYSLIQAYRLRNNKAYLEAVKKAFSFEKQYFSKKEGNWQDLRNPNAEIYSLGWCHGAPGCAMARLACSDYIDCDEEIQLALLRCKELSPSFSSDSFCCGRAGHADLFLLANERLNEKIEPLSFAGKSSFNPGLFQGLAGIGYQILRQIDPKQIPSILLWQ